jgi:hypothetical protein
LWFWTSGGCLETRGEPGGVLAYVLILHDTREVDAVWQDNSLKNTSSIHWSKVCYRILNRAKRMCQITDYRIFNDW